MTKNKKRFLDKLNCARATCDPLHNCAVRYRPCDPLQSCAADSSTCAADSSKSTAVKNVKKKANLDNKKHASAIHQRLVSVKRKPAFSYCRLLRRAVSANLKTKSVASPIFSSVFSSVFVDWAKFSSVRVPYHMYARDVSLDMPDN